MENNNVTNQVADAGNKEVTVDKLTQLMNEAFDMRSNLMSELLQETKDGITAVNAAKAANLVEQIKALDLILGQHRLKEDFSTGDPILDAISGTNKEEVVEHAQKNHRPSRPVSGRKYVLLSNKLNSWGKVPQQQADLAKILTDNFKVGEEVGEEVMFATIAQEAPKYESFRRSVQDPTYIFRYYRGLKRTAVHASFVTRGLFRVI